MHFDQADFLGDLSRFARRLLTSYDVEETLEELLAAVTRRLGLRGAAVCLGDDGVLRCAAVVPKDVRALEEVQLETQEGPCVRAFRIREPVLVPELAHELDDWPRYRPHAERLGIRAVAGVPMLVDGESIGVLTLYAEEAHHWSTVELASLVAMADMVTGYVLLVARMRRQDELTDQLQVALESRVVIEQAKGMVANSLGTSVEQAFVRIQHHARAHHTNVRAVSEAVVHLGLKV